MFLNFEPWKSYVLIFFVLIKKMCIWSLYLKTCHLTLKLDDNYVIFGVEAWPAAVEIGHVSITPLHHGKCLTNKHISVLCKIIVCNTVEFNFPVINPNVGQRCMILICLLVSHQISKLDTPLMVWNWAAATATATTLSSQTIVCRGYLSSLFK